MNESESVEMAYNDVYEMTENLRAILDMEEEIAGGKPYCDCCHAVQENTKGWKFNENSGYVCPTCLKEGKLVRPMKIDDLYFKKVRVKDCTCDKDEEYAWQALNDCGEVVATAKLKADCTKEAKEYVKERYVKVD